MEHLAQHSSSLTGGSDRFGGGRKVGRPKPSAAVGKVFGGEGPLYVAYIQQCAAVSLREDTVDMFVCALQVTYWDGY